MSVLLTAEDCVYLFLKGLDDEDLKLMKSGRDVENRIDEESIEEIKDRIWDILQNQIHWERILEKVKQDIGMESDDEEEDAKTDSDKSDDEED